MLFDHSTFNGHPRFFGYITSSPAPIGMFGDLLAAAVNANIGGWAIGAGRQRNRTCRRCRWIAEFIGFPIRRRRPARERRQHGELRVLPRRAYRQGRTGCAQSGPCGRREARNPTAVVYASAETHTWIQKAADLFGLGTDAIRWIPVDDASADEDIGTAAADRGRPRATAIVRSSSWARQARSAPARSTRCPKSLRSAASLTCGFTSTARTARWRRAVPGVPTDLRALAEADSVAVDPHKWLYAPLEAGCALVRQPCRISAMPFRIIRRITSSKDDVVNFVDYGLQNSRGFRALKVWLALAAHRPRRLRGVDRRRHTAVAPARRCACGSMATSRS